MAGRPRVILFGIDGGDLELVEPWARSGELPTLGRLLREGSHGRLRSTIHPLTPQAWSSLLTGVNPGKHGVFDFGRRRPGSYRLMLTDGRARRAPALWDHLAAHGLSCGVINVPLTFPLEPVQGYLISGMHAPSLEQAVHPPELLAEVRRVAPRYRLDVMSPWYADTESFLRDLHEMTEERARLAVHLFRTRPTDVFMLVMVAVDRVCHALWGQLAHPWRHNRDGRLGWRYSREVLRAYQAVDAALGELLAAADEGTRVVVCSDHGFGSLERDVSLNQALLEAGLLSFSPEWVRPRLPVVGVAPGAAGRTLAEAGAALLGELARRALPPLRRRADEALRRGQVPPELRRWEYVDWSRSVAYSHGLFGNVYLNLRGREPEGCVAPEDYERTRARVAEALAALTDPDDGASIVDRIYRREELYSGPCLDDAPDLIVVMRSYAYMTRGGRELAQTRVVERPAVQHTGNHRPDGMIVLWGPGIRQAHRLRSAAIVDVLPTVLALLGRSPPEGLDGRVLDEALERREHLALLARRLVEPATGGTGLAPDEELLVRRRLKNLGYLE